MWRQRHKRLDPFLPHFTPHTQQLVALAFELPSIERGAFGRRGTAVEISFKKITVTLAGIPNFSLSSLLSITSRTF